MKQRRRAPQAVPRLRRQALSALRQRDPRGVADDATDSRKLLHELQVHQVELELQNDEMQRVQAELQWSLQRYADLFQFAPVACLMLSRSGVIDKANRAAGEYFAIESEKLVGQRFAALLPPTARPPFAKLLRQVFAGAGSERFELTLGLSAETRRQGELAARLEPGSGRCQLAILDIDRRHRAEHALRDSRSELRRLSQHREQLKEDERKRIAREIHDELGQSLLALRIDMSALLDSVRATHPELQEPVAGALRKIDGVVGSVRDAIRNLRPAVLDLGLAASIQWQMKEFERRTGMYCRVRIRGDFVACDDGRATALFRILQEALSNIIRHAQARRVAVGVSGVDGALALRISDDGVGIDADARRKKNAYGLLGIQERVDALGGAFSIASAPGKGTELAISIPLPEAGE